MKKYMLDMKVAENIRLEADYCLLKLSADGRPLPEMLPGQFAQVRVDTSPTTFLRRPISIHYVDEKVNQLWLLIQLAGDGTRAMASWQPGENVNLILPLGNSFTLPESAGENVLLVGGGVGTAPMLFLGSHLVSKGFRPVFLLGARSADGLLQLDEFRKLGDVHTTTEDGSAGEKGYVTHHSILRKERFDRICTCGPRPMMEAVARYAKTNGIRCEVSLENTMACGIGACLCCVEKTTKGHVCVCTEGPVFNIDQLTWQI